MVAQGLLYAKLDLRLRTPPRRETSAPMASQGIGSDAVLWPTHGKLESLTSMKGGK